MDTPSPSTPATEDDATSALSPENDASKGHDDEALATAANNEETPSTATVTHSADTNDLQAQIDQLKSEKQAMVCSL